MNKKYVCLFEKILLKQYIIADFIFTGDLLL